MGARGHGSGWGGGLLRLGMLAVLGALLCPRAALARPDLTGFHGALECSACHLNVPAPGTPPEEIAFAGGDANAPCLSCHGGNHGDALGAFGAMALGMQAPSSDEFQANAMAGARLNCYTCHCMSISCMIPGSRRIRVGMGLDQLQMCRTCHVTPYYAGGPTVGPFELADRGFDPTWPGTSRTRIYVFELADQRAQGKIGFRAAVVRFPSAEDQQCSALKSHRGPSPGNGIRIAWSQVGNPANQGQQAYPDLWSLQKPNPAFSWNLAGLTTGRYEVRLIPFYQGTDGVPFVFRVDVEQQAPAYRVQYREVTGMTAGSAGATNLQLASGWREVPPVGDGPLPVALGRPVVFRVLQGETPVAASWALASDLDLTAPLPSASEEGRHFLIWRRSTPERYGGEVGFFFTDGYAYAANEPALGKLFWPVHLGEGTVGVAVGGAPAAQFVVRVVRPSALGLRLGTSRNEFDYDLEGTANVFGIPPQLIKAVIHRESVFDPTAYRYEPKYDFNLIAPGCQPGPGCQDRRDALPYADYRVATGIDPFRVEPDLIGPRRYDDGVRGWGTRLLSPVGPGSPDVRYRERYVLRDDSPADGFYSQREILEANRARHYRKLYEELAGDDATLDGMRYHTAQTTLAASYGYMQVMWGTAAAPLRWNVANGWRDMNPSYLTAGYSPNVELGCENLLNFFEERNRDRGPIRWYDTDGDGRRESWSGLEPPNGVRSLTQWQSWLEAALSGYNGRNKATVVSEYSQAVWALSLGYYPK